MVLQSSGPISLKDIATEFKAGVPYVLGDFWKGGALVPANSTGGSIPTTRDTLISMSSFYGAAITAAVFNEWASDFQSAYVYSIIPDQSGNTFITGYTEASAIITNADGSTAFSPGTSTYTYFAKFNASGTITWLRYVRLGTINRNTMDIDPNSNLLTTFSTISTATNMFDGSGNSVLSIPASTNLMIVKFDTSGIVTLTGYGGKNVNQDVSSIKGDASGNFYVSFSSITGTVTNKIYDFSGNVNTTVSNNGLTGVVAKFDSVGNILWTRLFPNYNTNIQISSMDLDSSGNLYIATIHQALATLYNASGSVWTTVPTSTGTNSIGSSFLIKYNPSGIGQWVSKIDGVSYFEDVSRLVVRNNSLYICGNFAKSTGSTTTAIFYNASGTSIFAITGGNRALGAGFWAKYNLNGTPLLCVKTDTTSTSSLSFGNGVFYGVDEDANGNIYVSGRLYGNNDSTSINNAINTIYNADGTVFKSYGGYVTFVAKYNSSGIGQWIQTALFDHTISTPTQPGNNLNYDSDGVDLRMYSRFNTVTDKLLVAIQATNKGGYLLTDSNDVHLSSKLTNITTELTAIPSSGIYQISYDKSKIWSALIAVEPFNNQFDALPAEWLNASTITDASGNIYISFNGTYGDAAYDTGPSYSIYDSSGTVAKNIPADTTDCLIVKFDSQGIHQWTVYFTGGQCGIQRLAIDQSGNLYGTGYVSSAPVVITIATGASSNASVTDTTNTSTLLPIPRGTYGAFIIKFNSLGVTQWMRKIDSLSPSEGNSIGVNATGEIYVCGRYTGAANVYNSGGSIATSLLNAGSNSGFLVKYNSSGTALWARRIDGTSNDGAYDITLDPSGNIYMTGYYTGTGTIYTTGSSQWGALSAATSTGAYAAKYDSFGTPLLSVRVDGSAAEYGTLVTTDAVGNMYMAVNYNSSGVTIYNSDGTQYGTRGAGQTLIIKYNASGMVQWVLRTANVDANGLVVDSNFNVIVSYSFATSSRLGICYNANDTSSTTIAEHQQTVKYNSSGVVIWAIGIDGLEESTSAASTLSGAVGYNKHLAITSSQLVVTKKVSPNYRQTFNSPYSRSSYNQYYGIAIATFDIDTGGF